ncbi:MAG TPA: NADH-quinone oxidoreductase subunit C [Bryobacteraceae bacterium]|nr:NADH-quinone oxidoreductase subunit C [Bryobacteraceae bacterium]
MLPEALREIPTAAAIEAFDPLAVEDGKSSLGELTLFIDSTRILPVCRFLKTQRKFNRLSGLTGVDWYPMEPRFEVVYLLHSLETNERLRLKCRLTGEDPVIDSVYEVWKSADWYERETFDLFGIIFKNHPNLTRIMLPETWKGHPLRKDFPVHGYRYSYKDES